MDSATGRILVVDDDAALLKVLDAYLTRLGYLVDPCRNAAEAWALLQANPSAYTGALVDLNLPGARGEELARRILDSNPSICLVAMSGSPVGLGRLEAWGELRVRLLPKPFSPRELAQALAAGL